MADEKNPPSGASGASGGADADNQNQDQGNQGKTVSWEDHQRALKDVHKFKSALKEKEQAISQIEEERLKQANDWKALAEREKAARATAEEENKSLKAGLLRTQKYDAVKQAAVEAGLRPEALGDLDLLDLDGVVVEGTTHGRLIVHGAKEFVQSIKTSKPHWFKTSAPPAVNAGSGSAKPGQGKKLTPQDVNDAEKKYLSGRITKDEYYRIHKEYLGQPKTT